MGFSVCFTFHVDADRQFMLIRMIGITFCVVLVNMIGRALAKANPSEPTPLFEVSASLPLPLLYCASSCTAVPLALYLP